MSSNAAQDAGYLAGLITLPDLVASHRGEQNHPNPARRNAAARPGLDKPKNPIQLPQIGSDRAAWLDDRSGPQRKFLTIAKDDDAEMIGQISRACGLCSTEAIIGAGARFRPFGARNPGWFDYRRSMAAAARPACNSWSWTPSGIFDPDCGIAALGTSRWPPKSRSTRTTSNLRPGRQRPAATSWARNSAFRRRAGPSSISGGILPTSCRARYHREHAARRRPDPPTA